MAEPGCNEQGVCLDPKAYFFYIIGKREGDPADDFEAVITEKMVNRGAQLNVPANQLPKLEWKFKAIAVMTSGRTPRGRLFLPSNVAQHGDDGNQWFTQDVQYIADGPDGGLIWKWRVLGGTYVPIHVIHGVNHPTPPVQPPIEPEPPPDGGDQHQELQAQIDELQRAVKRLEDNAMMYNQNTAIRMDSGQVLSADGGGPSRPEQRVTFQSRSQVGGGWEKFRFEKA